MSAEPEFLHTQIVHTKEEFIEAVADLGWATIDQIRQRLTERGFWTEDDAQRAIIRDQNSQIRRLIRDYRDSAGWPIFANVENITIEGEPIRIYKQEALFGPDDYRQVLRFWVNKTNQAYLMTVGYQQRAKERYGVELDAPIDFKEGV